MSWILPKRATFFACLGAVVSVNDSASLFRVASFPQFAIDPEKLRAGIKAIPREERRSGLASGPGQDRKWRRCVNAFKRSGTK